MDAHQMKWNEQVAQHLIAQLEKRRMEGSYAPTATQAKAEILGMIPPAATVFRCGSMTAGAMGLWEAIRAIPGVEVIDPFQPGLSPADGLNLRRKGMTAEVMLASTNAITLDGRLVNLDGTGNRVAAMIFGPNRVILAVGMNKVCADLESAMARVKHVAGPANAIRVGVDTPCAKNGLCVECRSPQRICNSWSVIEGQMTKGRIHVKLIGETLGY